jgi:hypothetical protein
MELRPGEPRQKLAFQHLRRIDPVVLARDHDGRNLDVGQGGCNVFLACR